MSEALQRVADADAAKAAWERFVAPTLATIRADYMVKLTDEAVKPMEGLPLQVVQNLSLALKVMGQVEAQMRALIMDGQAAQADLDRAGSIARLSPQQRRYATY